MRKIGLFLIVLLLIVSFNVAQAQESLPWAVNPEKFAAQDTDTLEFPIYGDQQLPEQGCLRVAFHVNGVGGSDQRQFRLWVQQIDHRFSENLVNMPGGIQAGKTYAVHVLFSDLLLEDPSSGLPVDGGGAFDPTAGEVSGIGIHIWDSYRQWDLMVTEFGVWQGECRTSVAVIEGGIPVQTAPRATTEIMTVPQVYTGSVIIPSGTIVCHVQGIEAKGTDGAYYIKFPFTVLPERVQFVQGDEPQFVEGQWMQLDMQSLLFRLSSVQDKQAWDMEEGKWWGVTTVC